MAVTVAKFPCPNAEAAVAWSSGGATDRFPDRFDRLSAVAELLLAVRALEERMARLERIERS